MKLYLTIFFTIILHILPTPLLANSIDFTKQIKPILDKRCVVCHSCYNSPCQLKLSSYEGLDRGATKRVVYDNRLTPAELTRLFIDANSTKQWRGKGFFSVIEDLNSSILAHFLRQKEKSPQIIGKYEPEKEELQCSKNQEELNRYFRENPDRGMPYGFPTLKKSELDTIYRWLSEGAKESKKIDNIKNSTLDSFELFLNKRDIKHKVTARYIYEHLFLAHIKFPNDDSFYRLVRSYTPIGKDIDEVASRFPYEEVKKTFYYRFKKIESTIVHKTHMVYKLDSKKLKRYKELFIEPKWVSPIALASYNQDIAANPLKAFKMVPVESRYKFLLDDVQYFIMNFIRGPVCKGQVALNVINDHFWVAFKEPSSDVLLKDREFLKDNLNNLDIPNEYGSDTSLLDAFDILKFSDETIKYYKNKNRLYKEFYKDGLDIETIWRGNHYKKENNDAILTIYRHFDSASVHKGALGDVPKTMWVIDYPLLERLYYSLVVGFDVYGNITHQLLVRKYMDRLRIEGESNFLEYLPKDSRRDIFKSWYLGWLAKQLTTYTPSDNKTAFKFYGKDYKFEFINALLDYTKIKRDKINYLRDDLKEYTLKKSYETKDEIEEAMKFLTLPQNLALVKHLNGFNSNLSYLKIEMQNKKDLLYSLVVNRWHDSVALLFNEDLRLNSQKDKLNFIEGFIGSYPNIFIVVKQKDLYDFFTLLKDYDGSEEFKKKLKKYFISRSNKEFWSTYDWFQERFNRSDKINSGLFDLNRYYPEGF